jgi:hypothetical protein
MPEENPEPWEKAYYDLMRADTAEAILEVLENLYAAGYTAGDQDRHA